MQPGVRWDPRRKGGLSSARQSLGRKSQPAASSGHLFICPREAKAVPRIIRNVDGTDVLIRRLEKTYGLFDCLIHSFVRRILIGIPKLLTVPEAEREIF